MLHRMAGKEVRVKRWLLLLWLLLPLPVLVWHFGAGQKWLARDRAHDRIREAEAAEVKQDYARAEALFGEAAKLAGDSDSRTRLQLDLALVRMHFRRGAAVEAIDGADRILADPAFHQQPEDLKRDVRELAGRIHYYAAWVMRLEGAQRELWLEEAELARQNYRLLTEHSLALGAQTFASSQQTNLEAAVRLQRMSLLELMARPLPEEGEGMAGQGLSEQMGRRRGQRGQGNQPGIGENDEGPPGAGAGTMRFPGGPGS
jgi:hypothetical protein